MPVVSYSFVGLAGYFVLLPRLVKNKTILPYILPRNRININKKMAFGMYSFQYLTRASELKTPAVKAGDPYLRYYAAHIDFLMACS